MQLLKVLKFVIHLEIHLFRQHQGSRLTGAGVPVAAATQLAASIHFNGGRAAEGRRQKRLLPRGCCRAAEFALPLLTFTLSARTELNEATLTL